MLSLLFQKFKNQPQNRAFRIPEGWRVYAIGDIHGRDDLLRELHQIILEDSMDNPDLSKMAVYLGDYVDRGARVRETIDELLYHPLPGFSSRYLMGNHEQLLLSFLDDPSILQFWINIGGSSTLLSYGVQAPGSGFSASRVNSIRGELISLMPKAHLSFIQSLEPYVLFGDYLFVHAGIRPGIDLEAQKPDDIFWIRDEFLDAGIDHGFRVVHGHTIDEQIQEHPNRIGVDTGACSTGVLTCAILEDDQVNFLHT